MTITTEPPVGYCAASGNTGYEWIASVASGSFSHASAKEGYADNSGLVIPLVEGSNSFNLTAGGSYTEHWAAWIDFNNDGVFDSSEKVLTGVSGKDTVAGNITIPAGYEGQQLRLRIAMKYGSEASSACGAVGDGEIEDYTVSISAGTGGGGGGNSNVPDACATQSPVTDARLEDGVPVCLGQASTIWMSMADVNAFQSVAITTAHGTGNLDVFYKNGGWPSESDNHGSSTGSTNSECIYLTNASQYWSYLKVTGSASGATIIADFDTAGCR
ncbi:MAG: PPC domain-containing protein [Psychrosphaera sp.]|nr:PPC domain-containing protein [Psychrosphaera sp.]